MIETDTELLRQKFLNEHEELSRQIDEMKCFWREVNELGQGPKYEEMAYRVQNLREQLKNHFDSETKEGYLSSPQIKSSIYAEQAEILGQQHAQLLDSLDRFIAALKQCDSAFHCWQEVRSDFDEFLKTLYQHEASETKLVENAMHELKQK